MPAAEPREKMGLVVLHCEECERVSLEGRGWMAFIVEDEDEPETPAYVVSYCPTCAEREFGVYSPRVHGA